MLMVDSQADAASRSATAEDLSGNKRTFNVDYVGNGRYEMRDLERKITTYEVTGYNYHLEFDFNWFVKEPALPGDVVAFASGDSLSRTAVSLHSNMAAAYDFYKDVLGRRSYSGNASTELEVSYNDQTTGANAYWSPTGQRFVFGSRGNYGAGLDVVGHEFTHAVICYVVGSGFDNGLIYYGESGALNESYADIMGSLVEGKTGSGRWLHGEDQAKANRSLANPKEYGQPDRYSDRVVTDGDNGGVHTNSGIFNHAAYKMMTDSRTSGVSQKKWARVFYHSLFRLPQDATFLDARYAVSAAAAKLGFTASELYAIDAAFDEVGIVEPDEIRIVMRWGSDPDDLDSHFVGPLSDGGRFHVYFEDMNAFEDYVVHTKVGDEVSTVYHVGRVADLNRDDTDSYGPEITTLHRMAAGDYYFFVHDYTTGDSADSQALAHSRAYVSVWRKGECIGGPYYVDPASHGTFWAVFKMRVSASGGVSVAEMNEYGSSSIVSGLLD